MAIFGDKYIEGNYSGNFSLTPEDFDLQWKHVIEDFQQKQFTLREPITIVLIALYVPIFIMSLVGNILVLAAIVPNQRMWTVTNNFLVNLAVADLLVTLLCVPMTVAGKVYRLWVYGEALCKLTPYLQGVAVTSSTFTITAMSLDRCLSILHPMKFRSLRTSRNVRILILILWGAAMILMMPLLFVNQTKSSQVFTLVAATCTENWGSVHHKRIYDFALLFIICLIPAQIVMVSYILMGKRLWVSDAQLRGNGSDDTKFIHAGSEKRGRDSIRASRRRTAKMCIVVSVVFVVCWLPYYCVHIYLDFKRDFEAVDVLYYMSLLIGHLHCITNPILYCFMHKAFRHCVMRMLPCWKSRFLREGSLYGTNTFTRYRMSSYRATTRSQPSQRSNSRKAASSDNSATPELRRSNQVDTVTEVRPLCNGKDSDSNSAQDRNYNDLTSKNTNSNITEAQYTDLDTGNHRKQTGQTKRKVRLIFSRCRDPSTSKLKLNSVKIVSGAADEENSKAPVPSTALMSESTPLA